MFKQDNKMMFDFSYQQIIEDDLTCAANQNLNLFEYSIKEAIDKFQKEYNKYCEKESDISDKISEIEIKQSNLDESKDLKYKELQNHKIELYNKQHYYFTETYLINEQLKSLSEMQIINTFKNIEINMKTLIHIAYPKIKTKEFYKWDSLIQFFNSKNIPISKIQGYQEITELKNLNNSIKHNGILNDNLKKIEEFKTDDEFNFVNLINFYERIKDTIKTFLNLLAEEIKKDLFHFNEDRLNKISQDLKQRMEASTIETLILKLKE
ncbi:hypothetical protein FPF71_14805 [Algibacter amylolyticus]|uniref:Uncharacterized protein n=1 Tax=Algibacter amylolyticus TaxID=1608400 RepID=A0A5M7B524_9FLAO|nr:hypothetical protein [Algibacter amylolyticus]KAA5822415.1 hypothetical protein F2B50_14805 [Algibacter amylolyticus]MBB5269134.1 hypothetical protein [Algibacter amylolyticus]TSJ73565.1 hypothetical protein FPF71_14805 [Algibacter amylolyticus]